MSALSYKGINVNVDINGTFRAEVRGEFVESDRLKDLESKIDAELQRTAPKLSLPIVAIDRGKLIAATLTGISRADSSPRFSPASTAPNLDTVLADTPKNRALLEQFEAARVAYETLRADVQARAAYKRGYGRIAAGEYDRVLEKLQRSHAASMAAGAES